MRFFRDILSEAQQISRVYIRVKVGVKFHGTEEQWGF